MGRRPRMFPYVDIVIPSRKRRTPSPPPSPQPKIEPPSRNSSPRKKVKVFHSQETIHGDETKDLLIKGSRLSPTVSDFNVGRNEQPLPLSPTVSDFNVRDDSPGPSVVSLTMSLDDDDEVTYPHNLHVVTSKEEATSQDSIIYQLMEDELQEDQNLVIHGETLPDELETSSLYGSEEMDDVPVRMLDQFAIYDMASNKLVSADELSTLKFSSRSYRASGLVTPWVESIDGDDDNSFVSESETDGEQRTRLSKILELSVHHYSEDTKCFDAKIYIRTSFAWYILSTPSETYKPYFCSLWLKHRLLHLLVTAAIEEPRITYEEFVDNLADPDKNDRDEFSPLSVLGRHLSREDLEAIEVNSYLVSCLPELCEENKIHINRVPLIKTILGSAEIPDVDYGHGAESHRGSKSNSKTTKKAHARRDGISNPTSVTVTPIVSRIAGDLFKGLEVVGSSEFDALEKNVAAEMDSIKEHHENPKNIVWGEQAEGDGKFYDSVMMDGVRYEVGDVVMVNPGEDGDAVRAKNAESEAAKSVNSYANLSWFARVCYFFEVVDRKGKEQKMFHGQWFVHGSKTILQETAHSKALYFTNDCDDIPIASIFRECKLRMLTDSEEEPYDDREPDCNDFHCGLMCLNFVDFIHLPSTSEIDDILMTMPGHMPCYSCGVTQQKASEEILRPIPGGFVQFGIKYHADDFVYLRNRKETGLLDIAQILKVKGPLRNLEVLICYFERIDDVVSNIYPDQLPSDERRLYRTKRRAKIAIEDLDGVCHVRHLKDLEEIEKWIQQDNHFYVNEEIDDKKHVSPLADKELRYCQVCHEERIQELRRAERLRQQNPPLRGLELFSGAGGLGTGMNLSGFVETKYAVEYIPSAASTYKTNHPDTTVYCQDTCLLLKHAIETHEGKNPEPLLSNDGQTYCPPMPKKGDVDFLYGGPPCQSFSLANHQPQPDDPRSSLPGNMLSHLEFYEADFFLLENVRGILNFPLKSKRSEYGRSLEGGIKSGVVKFILRTLIALGYQARFKVLQAGQYGAPQGRSRVIFWGAKRGLPLPEHPAPMYAFPKPANAWNLPTGEKLKPISRSKNPNGDHKFAPLPFVNVNDTINDLPPFDWINPHVVFPATSKHKAEAKRRLELGIAQFRATSEQRKCAGFLDGASYATPPQNRYQKWLRQGMIGEDGEEKEVEGHYTKAFKANVVEATVTVPLKPNADHTHLPIQLQPRCARPGTKGANYSFYGRVDGKSYFKCAMTNMDPNQKKTWVVHPSQKRSLSVRECARAQGFPDHYNFESADKTVGAQTRQIGNAVPVPLALALGKELGAALMKRWEEKEREGSPIV